MKESRFLLTTCIRCAHYGVPVRLLP